ncbi:MAG: DUF2071 domain-containing protein [Bacteroidetes bacterium]|nr:DUF2071 domain-containing protein [Bacteroidota bacterium]
MALKIRSNLDELLAEKKHRPFDYPYEPWAYYQEWNKVLFLHWKLPVETLRKLVPSKLILDTFHGDAYVSLVAFTMQKARPEYLPAIKCISDFGELNIRTYVEMENKKGVYFLNIEAEKTLSALLAKTMSGLPYEKSDIQKSGFLYKNHNKKKGFYLETEFEPKDQITNKSELDKWLTERYCLYLEDGDGIFRYDIHHREWDLQNVEIKQLKLHYRIGDMELTNSPNFVHYSKGVQVLAWKRTRLFL